MDLSDKILKTFLFLLYIPLFRIITVLFIKAGAYIMGENLKGFFELSFKGLEFMAKYIVPIMVLLLIQSIWF